MSVPALLPDKVHANAFSFTGYSKDTDLEFVMSSLHNINLDYTR